MISLLTPTDYSPIICPIGIVKYIDHPITLAIYLALLPTNYPHEIQRINKKTIIKTDNLDNLFNIECVITDIISKLYNTHIVNSNIYNNTITIQRKPRN